MLDSPSARPRPDPSTRRRGFTLIELMITVVLIGLLAAIAYPSFMGQVRKSRRAEAVATISQIQQAQERWRSNCTAYASDVDTAAGAGCTGGLGVSAAASARYLYALPSASGASYVATATAVVGSSQASDTGCTILTATVVNGSATFTPTACWSR